MSDKDECNRAGGRAHEGADSHGAPLQGYAIIREFGRACTRGLARRYILDSPRTLTFLSGFGKLYLTTLGHHKRYFDAMRLRLGLWGHKVKVVEMYGHDVVSVRAAQ